MKHGWLVLVAACADPVEPLVATCGEAPFADVEIAVENGGEPVTSPVDVVIEGCRMRTDDHGRVNARISNSEPHAVLLENSSKYAPTIHPERGFAEGPVTFAVMTWAEAESTPGYCVDEGNVLVQLADGGCGVAGATIEIAEYPDIAPLYLASATTFATESTTTAYGAAMFARVNSLEPIEVIVRKPGCEALTEGRLPTESGAISTTIVTLVTP